VKDCYVASAADVTGVTSDVTRGRRVNMRVIRIGGREWEHDIEPYIEPYMVRWEIHINQ